MHQGIQRAAAPEAPARQQQSHGDAQGQAREGRDQRDLQAEAQGRPFLGG